MFAPQFYKLAIIACIVAALLVFFNSIISAILSVLIYILGFFIIVGLALIVFIPEKKWINGANKAQEISQKLEEKIMHVINRTSKNAKKLASSVDAISDKLEQIK